jgi:hypothetical protein
MEAKGWTGPDHARKSGPHSEPASNQLQISLEEPLQHDDETNDRKHCPYDSHICSTPLSLRWKYSLARESETGGAR